VPSPETLSSTARYVGRSSLIDVAKQLDQCREQVIVGDMRLMLIPMGERSHRYMPTRDVDASVYGLSGAPGWSSLAL
jgi:hypothetical protein